MINVQIVLMWDLRFMMMISLDQTYLDKRRLVIYNACVSEKKTDEQNISRAAC